MKNYLVNILLFLLLFIRCAGNNTGNDSAMTDKRNPQSLSMNSATENNLSGNFRYDLKNPHQSWALPPTLIEVSGNTWIDQNHLLLISDSYADLFLIKIDGESAVLQKKIPLQKNEKSKLDIEDVTIVNHTVYVLSSHGALFKISNWDSSPLVKQISTFLTKENNAEGLCYDPLTKSLLIACKFDPGIKDADKSTKAVYRFDMTKEKLEKQPFLIFEKKDFEKLVGHKLLFYPSAIAIHPVTHAIYLLSTRENKCMAVFNREGKLISFQFIDEDLMPQAEGICFSPEGILYVSSEGKRGEPGRLFQFRNE